MALFVARKKVFSDQPLFLLFYFINIWLHCVSKSDIFIFNVFDSFGLQAAVGYDRPLKIEFICICSMCNRKDFLDLIMLLIYCCIVKCAFNLRNLFLLGLQG